MARPRRNPSRRGARRNSGEGKKTLLSDGNEVQILSDSSCSDVDEGGGSPQLPSFETYVRPKRRASQVAKATAAQPRVSGDKSSEDVVESDSDSSDPEFEESSTDKDSDVSVSHLRQKQRRRTMTEEQASSGGGSERRGRGTRVGVRRNSRKGRGRGTGRAKAKVQVPIKKLEWQISDEEWDNVWGDADDCEFEALGQQKLPLEQNDTPSELLMPLLPFQKEWLAWSLKQEASELKGGILADEMGMGKTIQAISLIVAGRALLKESGASSSAPHVPVDQSDFISGTKTGAPAEVKATLVVCPLVAVIQWRNEIARFTAGGSFKVLVYHGPRRSLGLAELSEYDVVLTTYSIVELEHRKHVMPPKGPCKWCAKTFYPDRLIVHQRYFCGPSAQRTEKQAKQVKRRAGSGKASVQEPQKGDVEASEDSQSSDEDFQSLKDKSRSKASSKSLAPGKRGRGRGRKASIVRGGGRKRKIDARELDEALQEAVESARNTTEKPIASNGNSVLHSVKWGRIVLDEAHSIKDRRCSTAKAVFALKSVYKWALSGTPLQNRVGELYSLVRFLGVHPFSYYFCRKCDCKSLDYQFSQGQKCECGHSPLLHFCWWNKFIANPIKRWGYENEGRKAMMLLKHKVLSNTLLRRTKVERAADLALPPRTAFLRRDAFDAREEDFYQALYTQSQSQFNTYVTAGTLLNNYAHIFDLLTRLRQAVDHPYLVVYSATACASAPKFESAVQEPVCGICHEPVEDSVDTACQHSFCRSCILEYIEAAKGLSSQCPSCEKPLTVDLTGANSTPNGKEATTKLMGHRRSSILNRIDLDQFQTSTKIDAVREEIHIMLQKDPAAKAIIFSQFTSMLDLIGFCLQKSGIKYVKLDGSMSMMARDQMIENFTNDSDTKVFLMSLKAGGVALNLTVASHVFLMDPWWNPAVEQQAQDRIHRLGQFKPIRVTRFVIENTIEERILKLQEKKQLVFEGTVGGSAEALGRLTEDDLRFLFTN